MCQSDCNMSNNYSVVVVEISIYSQRQPHSNPAKAQERHAMLPDRFSIARLYPVGHKTRTDLTERKLPQDITIVLASFPGPAQLSVASSAKEWERAWNNLSHE